MSKATRSSAPERPRSTLAGRWSFVGRTGAEATRSRRTASSGAVAVGDRPALLQRPALGSDDVALVGEHLLDLAAGPRPASRRGRRRVRSWAGGGGASWASASGGGQDGSARRVAGRGREWPAGRSQPGGCQVAPVGGGSPSRGLLAAVGDVRLDVGLAAGRLVPRQVVRLLPVAAVVAAVAVTRAAHRCLSVVVLSSARPTSGSSRTCRAAPARAPSADPSSSSGPSVRQRATG